MSKRDLGFWERFKGYYEVFKEHGRSVKHLYSVDVTGNSEAEWSRFLVAEDLKVRKAYQKQKEVQNDC